MRKNARDFFDTKLGTYPFTKAEKLEIAKIAFQITPSHRVLSHFSKFGLDSENGACDLALHLTGRGKVWDAVEICRRGKLSGTQCLEVGKAVAASTQSVDLARFAEIVDIEDHAQRLELAWMMARKHPVEFLAQVKKFSLQQEAQGELALLLAKSLPANGSFSFDQFDISDKTTCRELHTVLAARMPETCVKSLAALPLHDEKNGIEIARTIGQQRPELLFRHIERFGIADKSALQDLFFTYFKPALQVMADRASFEDAKLIHEKIDFIFSADEEQPDFAKLSGKLGIADPAISQMINEARAHGDSETRNALGSWSWYAALRLAGLPAMEQQPLRETFQPILAAIRDWREPEVRPVLTDRLAEALGTARSRQRLVDISAGLSKRHTHVFRASLCTLSMEDSGWDPLIKQLSELVSTDVFKDTECCRPILHALEKLIQAKHLSPQVRQRLLALYLSPQRGREEAAAVARRIPSLSGLLSLVMHPNGEIRRRVNSTLLALKKPADVDMALADSFFHVLDRKPDTENAKKAFTEKFNKYNQRSRYSNGIMYYAVSLFLHLPEGEEKQEIFKVLNAFIDDAVMSDDPKAALIKRRSDRNSSAHLSEAHGIDAKVTDRWLHLEKKIPLSELQEGNIALAQAKKRDFSAWTMEFVNEPEDYLLCGTEAGGKCQKIQASPKFNKALLGYAMQGKCRLLAMKSPDGKIQGRAIVRLGIDPQTKKLVMHLERPYSSPGTPENTDAIILEFARKMANEIGLPLMTHSDSYPGGEVYPNSLRFYPDSAACEYVDSHMNGVMNSRKGYDLPGGRIVSAAA